MSVEEVRSEVRALRAGRAVASADLAQRLGPQLRALCDPVGATQPPAEPAVLRQRLIAELNACARRLPADAAVAVRAALGLHAEATDPRLQGRVAWLAGWLGREERTALRRIDAGETLLAEQISAELARRRSQPVADGWHVARLGVLVRLDTPAMEVYEDRRIVADRDGVDEIRLGLSLPGPAGDGGVPIWADLRFGGRLVRQERPVPRRIQLVIALARPLALGEPTDVGLIARLGGREPPYPHYVLTATRPCDHFGLRVRFDGTRPPAWVRRVNGEPVRMLDTARPGAEPLGLDAAGEVQTEFARPALYLAYGVQWWPQRARA